MSERCTASTNGAVGKTLLALVGISGCLGGLAYAATGHRTTVSAPRDSHEATPGSSRPAAKRLPKPRITRHPAKTSLSTNARFAFTGGRRALWFQCRLDQGSWTACQGSIVFRRLAIGAHSFSVRALDRAGGRSSAARFGWALMEPKGFSIAPQLSVLSALYPGAAPVALPVVLTNPNGVPIFVTSLRVTVTGDAAGCSTTNLELSQSTASSSAPIKIPARASVSLPAGGASPPSIRLRDLPVNQDACRGAHFSLAFSGGARG